ncbi:N-acetylmuramic acid 6-phosphate etherase [Parapedobacter pyrenivorans]|uniref:N-acetylmuramic acid 6-phosphate etherase n=1 Tax=Parapedobacter pyrenivorans TaxID=1305674 RepID=A0A917MDY4_9SPHI|nr:N-acetylmuramic acid 6-phosphate etherase [Parapedobacter pyrenivorans]GGG97132.1 N-acetylmuramic acid 6-phosphate etherase [Parapedobacter pyrenivorans]
MEKLTEQSSRYIALEKQSVGTLLQQINQEDRQVALAVQQALPHIEAFVEALVPRMENGGRLVYIGAGTSGRLGVLDASECPPTFGIPADQVMGILAGGDGAIRKAVEFAEDHVDQGWKDLKAIAINEQDTLLAIAASGSTPYTLGALQQANRHGLLTACVVCNADSPIAAEAKYPITVLTGPELITGSTRMKAGTAQKMVLNMISTTVMIRLGRVKGNKMVDMQLSNHKLKQRGIAILMEETGLDSQTAGCLIDRYGNVRRALEAI